MSAMLEFLVPKAESEAFNSALYRFVETQGSTQDDDLVMLTSEPFGPVDRKSITLWSDTAVQAFTVFWSSVRSSPSLGYGLRA